MSLFSRIHLKHSLGAIEQIVISLEIAAPHVLENMSVIAAFSYTYIFFVLKELQDGSLFLQETQKPSHRTKASPKGKGKWICLRWMTSR